jgi:hypothetical protein
MFLSVRIRGCIGCCLALWVGTGAVSAQTSDSAFVAMEELGAHQFDDLPDGGRIQLLRDPADTAGTKAVRQHLEHIAGAFAKGDFTIPGQVHSSTQVPGTATMTTRRKDITYRFRPLPGGGEVRITTRDPKALQAVHQYLAFQRREHRHQR